MGSGKSPAPAQTGHAEDLQASPARLQTSSLVLQSLLESSPSPVFSVDAAYRYTSFNTSHAQVMKALYGADIEVGESILAYQTVEGDRREAQANLDRALRGERVVEDAFSGEEVRTRRSFEVTHDPIMSDGEIVGVVVQARDVTELKHAESEMRLLGDAIEASLDEIYVFSADTLRFRFVNYGARHNLGYTAARLRHMTPLDIKPEFTREAFAEMIAPLTSHERPQQVFRTVHQRADGTRYPVEVHLQLFDREPDRVFLAVIQDITERNRADAEISQGRRLLEEAQSISRLGGRQYDVEGDHVTWTDEVYRIHGLGRDFDPNDAGRDITFYAPHSAPLISDAFRKAVASAEPYDLEVELDRADGARIWVRTIGRPVTEDDVVVRITGNIMDITERKRAEEEVLRLNIELEQRVLDRTAQLDAANKELEAFAYSVSHDLRAPLRHIGGFAGVLTEVAGDTLDEEGRHCVDTICASVQEMGALIDDLLQFSRTGRAELQIANVDMGQALAEALDHLHEETDGRVIEWSLGPLPHVVGDHALLRQVWVNLLDNAIKYSRDRAPARIEVGALDGDTGESVFFVRDNGVGFDMRYADKLFGVFQRLHNSADFEGTGIGLANVQRIISRVGGRVWAEAELDKGATFSFSLPRRTAAE